MIRKLSDLCLALGMPDGTTEEILTLCPSLPFELLQPAMDKLFQPSSWEQGLSQLKHQLGEDPRGMKMLTCMLLCALKTRELYRERGIPHQVFLATMDCFPRFVREHMESFGCYGFDRDFWTVRQLSGVLFRIGLLEYELEDGKVCLHIPTGAHLDPIAIDRSLEEARVFLSRFFPAWQDVPMVCHSWLLSPTLSLLLPKDSNIIRFQNRFQITETDPEDRSFLMWVFKNDQIPYPQLPENTRLQQLLKQHLLQGGNFLTARGTLQ